MLNFILKLKYLLTDGVAFVFLSMQVLAGITSEENPFPSVQFHICTDV